MDPSSRHIDDQSAASQYPPPVSHNEQSDHDFAETAAAALLSAQPSEHAISHRPTPISHAITDTPNPRKRKPAAPGSRGVANLTPEQLAKKRANDREAQRAIRVRTKTTIETLERRIQELETQLPYQEVQKAYAERDRALAECEDLRRRLAAVAGIVGSQNLGQTGLNQLAALTAQQSPLPALSEQSQIEPSVEHPIQQHLHPDLRNDAQTDSPQSSG